MNLYADILTALREGVDVQAMLDTASKRLELERMITDIGAKEARFDAPSPTEAATSPAPATPQPAPKPVAKASPAPTLPAKAPRKPVAPRSGRSKPSQWREGYATQGNWKGAKALRDVAHHLTGHDYSTVAGTKLSQLSRWLNSDPAFEKVNGKWNCTTSTRTN